MLFSRSITPDTSSCPFATVSPTLTTQLPEVTSIFVIIPSAAALILVATLLSSSFSLTSVTFTVAIEPSILTAAQASRFNSKSSSCFAICGSILLFNTPSFIPVFSQAVKISPSVTVLFPFTSTVHTNDDIKYKKQKNITAPTGIPNLFL